MFSKTCAVLGSATFIAQVAGPGEAGSYSAIGWLMVTLFALIGGANQALQVWQRAFPKPAPPIDQVYATKAELARIEKRFEEWMTASDHTREEDRRVAQLWRDDLGKAVGRIEGKLDSLSPRRGK
ncbi:MAG: hypothetical protein EBR82_23455 [Caulobacteraceae bacterium]|nr:hypothetical protein [Caulobacteraceae bacterium]